MPSMRARLHGAAAGCAVVLAAALLCACGGSTGADRAAPRAPHPFLGVTAGAPLTDQRVDVDRELARMRAAGATTLRVAFYWREAQPYRAMSQVPAAQRRRFVSLGGVPTDLAAEDRIVAACARHGIVLLPVVIGTPDWAAAHPGQSNSPPAGTAPYTAFLRALIGRYGPHGSLWRARPSLPRLPVRDWQIWNEPNHVAYWSDQPFATRYVRLLRAARQAVRSADPGARVVLAGFADRSWDLLGQVYRAGGRGAFDIAAVHPYTFKVPNVLRIVRYDRAATRRAGDGFRPLWITELTWASAKGKVRVPLGFETTESDQAARLARAIPLLARQRRALGIGRIYWESWITYDRDPGNPFDFSGLREARPGRPDRDKPALAAFERVAKPLRDCGSRSIPGVCP